MTELTQPLAAAPSETIAAVPPQVVESHSTSFSELIFARFEWWREQRQDEVRSSIKTRYDAAVAAFERQHGEIVSAYWCAHVESAVVLTRTKPSFPWEFPIYSFFRESDWSTHNSPELACELHRCDELAVRAETVLTGVRQRICMQLVMASASHLLGLVDARAAHANAAETSAALQQERAALAKAETYYREAANGQAQMVYFSGMAMVAIAISIVAAVWLTISWASAGRGRGRRSRQRHPAHHRRKVHTRIRRRSRVRALPRRSPAADRRRLRNCDRFRLQRRSPAPPRRRE